MFMKSYDSSNRGNKDVARALSRKGQAINNLMKECHLQVMSGRDIEC